MITCCLHSVSTLLLHHGAKPHGSNHTGTPRAVSNFHFLSCFAKRPHLWSACSQVESRSSLRGTVFMMDHVPRTSAASPICAVALAGFVQVTIIVLQTAAHLAHMHLKPKYVSALWYPVCHRQSGQLRLPLHYPIAEAVELHPTVRLSFLHITAQRASLPLQIVFFVVSASSCRWVRVIASVTRVAAPSRASTTRRWHRLCDTVRSQRRGGGRV